MRTGESLTARGRPSTRTSRRHFSNRSALWRLRSMNQARFDSYEDVRKELSTSLETRVGLKLKPGAPADLGGKPRREPATTVAGLATWLPTAGRPEDQKQEGRKPGRQRKRRETRSPYLGTLGPQSCCISTWTVWEP